MESKWMCVCAREGRRRRGEARRGEAIERGTTTGAGRRGRGDAPRRRRQRQRQRRRALGLCCWQAPEQRIPDSLPQQQRRVALGLKIAGILQFPHLKTIFANRNP